MDRGRAVIKLNQRRLYHIADTASIHEGIDCDHCGYSGLESNDVIFQIGESREGDIFCSYKCALAQANKNGGIS